MYTDIFYVNRIPLFLSKIVKLNFLSGTTLKSRSGREIKIQSIEIKINMNNQASRSRIFMVTTNLIFGHSKIYYKPSIYIYMLKMNMSDSFRNLIKTIKERARSSFHTASYRLFTLLMTKSLVKGVVDMLKISPSKIQYQTPWDQLCLQKGGGGLILGSKEQNLEPMQWCMQDPMRT